MKPNYLAAVAVIALACTAGSHASDSRATITFTEHGIPHVRSSDFAGLGYGYGYAAASLDLCALSEVFLDVRGERARYLGASAQNGSALLKRTSENVVNDFTTRLLIDDEAVAAQRAGLTPQARDLIQGYADGFNRYLHDTPDEKRPLACRGAAWVQPITSDDVLRRVASAVFVSGMFDVELYDAHPPGAGAVAMRDAVAPIEPTDAGSNALALGSAHTSHGRGLLLGNPHWFWGVPNRFMQAHLTVPGVYDVSGASVLGMPLINIGYNKSMAWTHTVATDYRATIYELLLDPADPTRYIVDGKPRPMLRREISIDVRQPDGSVARSKHLFWLTEYGPVIQSAKLPWTTTKAYALADGNARDTRYLRQLIGMGEAGSVRELKRALAQTMGLVWVNTIAADAGGEVLYADYNAIPNVPKQVFDACTTRISFPQATLANVMDGSRSACRWRDDRRSNSGNTMPPDEKPALITRDYVENSNASHWLVNEKTPLEGYSPMIGRERSPLNLRTRFGHLIAKDFGRSQPDSSEEEDMQRLENALFSNRDYFAELVLDDLLKECNDTMQRTDDEQYRSSLSASCSVLARWDRKDNVDSRGAALFREFAREVKPAGEEDASNAAALWSVPFEPGKPLDTPRGLNTATSAPLEALQRAAERLGKAGVPLDAPLGDVQFIERNGKRIALHGGLIFNRISLTLTPNIGYTEPMGSADSYMQVVSFDNRGPKADTLLVNSQSGDTASPWYADQAALYARKTWVHVPFFPKDIERQAIAPSIDLVYVRQ